MVYVTALSGDPISASVGATYRGLHVELIETPGAVQARLVNQGAHAVAVSQCEIEGNGPSLEEVVGDVIQRWDAARGEWSTIMERRQCQLLPIGQEHMRFLRTRLSPGESLPTADYLHTSMNPVLHRGDRLRFVIFAENSSADSMAIPSPAFVVR